MEVRCRALIRLPCCCQRYPRGSTELRCGNVWTSNHLRSNSFNYKAMSINIKFQQIVWWQNICPYNTQVVCQIFFELLTCFKLILLDLGNRPWCTLSNVVTSEIMPAKIIELNIASVWYSHLRNSVCQHVALGKFATIRQMILFVISLRHIPKVSVTPCDYSYITFNTMISIILRSVGRAVSVMFYIPRIVTNWRKCTVNQRLLVSVTSFLCFQIPVSVWCHNAMTSHRHYLQSSSIHSVQIIYCRFLKTGLVDHIGVLQTPTRLVLLVSLASFMY